MTNHGGARPGAGRKKGSCNKSTPSNVILLPKQHGGARAGAGRKPGSGKYGEETKSLRIPLSMQQDVMHYVANKGFNLPVYAMRVPMGLTKPSIDYIEKMFNLNELVKHPAATFFHPVEGDSMEPTLFAGDLAMIDTALEPMHGDVVLASIDGGLTIKRYMKMKKRIWLEPDNKKYDPIILNPDVENMLCGVMLISIRAISLNHIKAF